MNRGIVYGLAALAMLAALAGCGRAVSTAAAPESAATPESAAPAAETAQAVTPAGPLQPLSQSDGDNFYMVVPCGFMDVEGVVCRIDATGVQTPLCSFTGCNHDGPQCPAWLADASRYQLFVLDGDLYLYYQPGTKSEMAATLEWYDYQFAAAGSETDQQRAAQEARRELYASSARLERLNTGRNRREWVCEYAADAAMQEDSGYRAAWQYTDGEALYARYTATSGIGPSIKSQIVRAGLDGTLRTQPLPRADNSEILGLVGTGVVYCHTASPVDLVSLETSNNTIISDSIRASADTEYRYWDMATGEDRLLQVEEAVAAVPLYSAWTTEDRLFAFSPVWNDPINNFYAGLKLMSMDLVTSTRVTHNVDNTDEWRSALPSPVVTDPDTGRRYAAMCVFNPNYLTGEVWVHNADDGAPLNQFATADLTSELLCPYAILRGGWVVCGDWYAATDYRLQINYPNYALVPLDALLNSDDPAAEAVRVTNWRPDGDADAERAAW